MKLQKLQETFLTQMQSFSSNECVINEPSERLAIYRNNSKMTRVKALSNTFPVTGRMLGEDCFRSLAKYYIQQSLSQAISLNDEGKHFVEFIQSKWENLSQLSHLVYLQDVLKLEWCIHCVLMGPDNSEFDFQTFAKVSETALELGSETAYKNIVFVLAENCCLLSSPFPIDRIWEMNQSQAEENNRDPEFIDLDETQEEIRLCIWRPNWDLHIKRLTMMEWEVLNCVKNGNCLGEIEEILSGLGKPYELEKVIPELIQRGCISGFGE